MKYKPSTIAEAVHKVVFPTATQPHGCSAGLSSPWQNLLCGVLTCNRTEQVALGTVGQLVWQPGSSSAQVELAHCSIFFCPLFLFPALP